MTTLNDALYQTLHRKKNLIKPLAEELGVSANYLYRSALPDPEESETGTGCRFPLNKLIPLTRATGDFTVLDFIEQSVGRVAFPLPKASDKLPDVYRLTMATVREFGQMIGQIDASVADGAVSEEEKARIIKEGYEAVAAIVNLLKSLEQEQ